MEKDTQDTEELDLNNVRSNSSQIKPSHQESPVPTSFLPQNHISFGLICVALALGWFAIGFLAFKRIFYFPTVLLTVGVISALMGDKIAFKAINESKENTKNGNMLDSDEL